MLKPRLMRTVRLRDRDRRQCSDSSPCYACRGGCGAAVDIFVKELERLERTRAGAAHLQGKGISSRPRMSVQILVNGIVAEAHFAQDFIGCPNLPELRAQGTPAQADNLLIAGLQSSRVPHGLTIRTS